MDAFAVLYEHHYQDVYRFALFLTSDPARAEDLASDTFVRAWMARERIHHPTVRAYLLAITRNLYRDQLRLKRPPSLELDERAKDARPGVDVRLEHRSELWRVRARLRHVAAGDRRALCSTSFETCPTHKSPRGWACLIGSVKSRIARAERAQDFDRH